MACVARASGARARAAAARGAGARRRRARPLARDAPEARTEKETAAVEDAAEQGRPEPGSAGFNQFDPAATLSRAITKRWGFAGGLAFVTALALGDAVEIGEALLRGGNASEGTGETVTTSSGLQYVDTNVVKGGTAPEAGPGLLVGLHLKVTVEDSGELLLDTRKTGRPVAWVYGKKFATPICDGVVEGVAGLKPGARRTLVVPPSLGFGSVGAIFPNENVVPRDASLVYEMEVLTVSPNWQ